MKQILEQKITIQQPEGYAKINRRDMPAEANQDVMTKSTEIAPVKQADLVLSPEAQAEQRRLELEQQKTAAADTWKSVLENETDAQAIEQAEFFKKNGISLQEYQQNPDQFNHFIKDPEKRLAFEKLLKEWQRVLDPSDYKRNKLSVWSMASSGMGFKQFVELHKYDWSAYFSTPLHEALKRKQLLSWFLQALKGVLMDLGKDLVGEENMKLLTGQKAEMEIEKQRAARVSWELVNANNIASGEPPTEEEKRLQEKDIREGRALDKKEFNAFINDTKKREENELAHMQSEEARQDKEEKRKQAIENARVFEKEPAKRVEAARLTISKNLPEALSEKFTWDNEVDGKAIIKIHEITGGAGKDGGDAVVGNYSFRGIAEKRRALEKYLEEEKGIASKELRAKISRELMEQGILGNSADEQAATPSPEDARIIDEFKKLQAENNVADVELADPAVRERLIGKAEERLKLTPEQVAKIRLGIARESNRTEPPQQTEDEVTLLTQQWAAFEAAELKKGHPLTPEEKADIQTQIKWGKRPTRQDSPHFFAADRDADLRATQATADAEAGTNLVDKDPRDRKRNESNKGFSDKTIIEGFAELEERKQKGLLTEAEAIQYENEKRRAYEDQPRNVEDLAWQIAYLDEAKWGTIGDFPLLEQKLDEKTGKMEWEVNKGNFIRWVRSSMMFLHGRSPDTAWDFAGKITLQKDYQHISIDSFLNQPGRYFRSAKKRDEKGQPELQQDIVDEIEREVWLFGASREFDINYRKVQGNEDQMAKKLTELYYDNTFTKSVWGKSSLAWIMTQDQNFEGKKGDKEKHDHQLGAAINTAYLAYYNIDDPKMLQRYLGKDTAFFDKDKLKQYRDVEAGIIKDIKGSREDVLAKMQAEKKMSDEEVARQRLEWDRAAEAVISDATLDKMFNKKNGVDNLNYETYHDTLNIFRTAEVDPKITHMVKTMVTDSLIDKHDLYLKDSNGNYKLDKNGQKIPDADNAAYAETFAYSMQRWTGAAARNDWEANGYDAWTKLQRTRPYRRKQSRSKSGGAFGNPYTLHELRALGTNFMTGIKTNAKYYGEDDGSGFYTRGEGHRISHEKHTLEVLEEIYNASQSEGDTDKNINKAASQLIFPELSMRQYALNHVNRTMGIFQSVVEAQEIKLEKFTKVDPLKGVMFERDQFSKVVQEDFLKPLRYAYSTWGQLDFTMPVRVWDPKKDADLKSMKPEDMIEVPLVEAMFGRELLDIPEFWQRDPNGTEKWIIKDGERVKIRVKEHVIDPAEIQKNKAQLWKQVAKTRIAAELYSHKDWHSNDTRYDFSYFETIIQALEQIPGGVEGDDTNMKDARVLKGKLERFFTEDDIKWIREKGGVSKKGLFWKAVLMAIGGGVLEGLKKSRDLGLKYSLETLTSAK